MSGFEAIWGRSHTEARYPTQRMLEMRDIRPSQLREYRTIERQSSTGTVLLVIQDTYTLIVLIHAPLNQFKTDSMRETLFFIKKEGYWGLETTIYQRDKGQCNRSS